MRHCRSSRLRGFHPAPRIECQWFRLLAPVLLILGILAASDSTAQQTRPGSLPQQKPSQPTKELPPDTPAPLPQIAVPQLPQGSSMPPGATEIKGGALIPATPAARFQFNIDPKSPLKDLLPRAPRNAHRAGPLQANDLDRVPEVQFEAAHDKANVDAIQHIAHQIAKINHLNNKKPDGFMEALRSERPDLTGLPFAMGDACRTKGERSKQFAHAVAMVRQAMQSPAPASEPVPVPPETRPASSATSSPAAPIMGGSSVTLGSTTNLSFSSVSLASVNPPSPETFWDQYQTLCNKEDKAQTRREQHELITCARIAALSQILMPMAQMHPGFAKYLSTVSHVEATKTLARLAIFSADEQARKAAVEALKVRRERDYTDILVNGLRYPWPTVARRAAVAIAKLERNDLLPQLIGVLEEPDPRAPVMREIKGKSVPVLREMVRVNHHRSCLLCHAPGNTGKVSADAVTAEVPVPGQPLTPPSGGYATSQQDLLVRVDVTYLRQDFSTFLAVADTNPWPEMQRFDFLVRTRQLSDDEATAYREKLRPREPGEFSPYHRAVLTALRELSGRDTEPTPQAWRRLLKLPAESSRRTATP